ncbi:MAG: tRNA (guanosine(37)-N1)-methyltransferase TrmD [Thermomicrobiales bacterium]
MSLVTFDFHNTLAHCDTWFALEIRELPGAVLRALHEERGSVADPDVIAAATASYRQLREGIMASGIEIDAHTSVMMTFAELEIAADPQQVEDILARIMRAAMHDVRPVAGAPDLVRDLHAAGFRIGVISSAVYHPFLEWCLASFGIAECIDFVITSASAGFYKSSTRIYEHALETAGVAPVQAIHIGDSPRWDVTTAHRAGMATVLLQAESIDPHATTPGTVELATPDLVVSSFVDAREPILDLARATGVHPAGTSRETSALPAATESPDTVDKAEPCTEEESSPALRVDIFTLFPDMFRGPFDESILKRAQKQGMVGIRIHDIRDWTHDKHRTADDTPYGGGAGMVMKAPPIVEAVEEILGDELENAHIAITSAGGRPFTQRIAHELSTCGRLVLICGHYEGIDERVSTLLDADELSIGDYVMTGGELPAMVIVDTVARLIPGVIDAESIADESHAESRTALVEYPHYTRPAEYRGQAVPEILLSGHHARIAAWREDEARKRTARWRPDLLANG